MDSYLRHSIIEHIDRAKEVGLDAIAVTWHRRIFADHEASAYARERGILVIPGMEADVEHRHLVVLNVAEGDLPGEPTWDQIRVLRAQKPKVFVLAPHPFYPHPCCLGSLMDGHIDIIDAVEWCMLHVPWLPASISPNLRAARWAHRHGKPLVACSDAHSLAAIGKNASTVEADELSADAIFAGIRAGRVTFHRRGLELGPLIRQASRAMASQPRHLTRWAKARLAARRKARLAATKPGSEAQAGF